MIYAFIYLLISLATARGKKVWVDIAKDPFGGIRSLPFIYERDNKNHDSSCDFWFWQRAASGHIKIRGTAKGIKKSDWFPLEDETDLNRPLYFSTSCRDGLWLDRLKLRAANSMVHEREYGTANSVGWCVSKDIFDWAFFAGNVAQKICWQTLKFQAYNSIPNYKTKGRVWGYLLSMQQLATHGRMLESKVAVNDFGAVLQEYLHCVQTLGDGQACESLDIAASDLFDEDKFVVLSEESDADETSTVLNNEMSEEDDSNNRRKL